MLLVFPLTTSRRDVAERLLVFGASLTYDAPPMYESASLAGVLVPLSDGADSESCPDSRARMRLVGPGRALCGVGA